ncbi:MAG: GxxExxY protein [Pyrinomonadaceae bacterium]|nr:GxxExxY protein [Pyrinomonadaceae bacterium]
MLKHYHLTERVIGTFYEVYNELGFGFLESVYEEAMLIALEQKGFQVEKQFGIPVWFRGERIGRFEADLILNGLIILELKAVRKIIDAHRAQLLNYLRATEIEVGLLLNFGPKPKFERIAFDNERKKQRPKPRSLIENLFLEE